MPTPIENFQKQIRRIERFRIRQSELHQNSQISSVDITFVYGILYLSVYSSFENFLEDQFVGLLAGRPYLANKPALAACNCEHAPNCTGNDL